MLEESIELPSIPIENVFGESRNAKQLPSPMTTCARSSQSKVTLLSEDIFDVGYSHELLLSVCDHAVVCVCVLVVVQDGRGLA